MRLHGAFALLAAVVPASLAIFADEAYHIDYHHALLGLPCANTTFFHRPQAVSDASLLYTLSEKLILGAVNPKDGSIVWRQNLARPLADHKNNGFLRAVDGENAVVSAVDGTVSSWTALDGKLSWSNTFADGPIKGLEIVDLHGQENTGAATKDSVVLFGDKTGIVRVLDGDWGHVKWEFRDDSGDIPFQISSTYKEIYYISLQPALLKGYKIKVTTLDPLTGRVTRQYSPRDNEIATPDSILYVGTATPFIMWVDKSNKYKTHVFGSEISATLRIDNNSGEEVKRVQVVAPRQNKAVPHAVFYFETESKSWAEIHAMDLNVGTIIKSLELPLLQEHSTFAVSNKDHKVYFTQITGSEIRIFSSVSETSIGHWRLANPRDETTVHAVSEVVERGSTHAVRFARLLESGDWELVRNGDSVWNRPEALAGVVAASWVEPDAGEELAHELEVEGHENLYGAYIHRLKRHARDLQQLPTWLRELPMRIFTSFLPSEIDLASFGLAKRVIVATENGHLAALDTGSQGTVQWNTKAADISQGKWNVKAINARHGTATAFVEDGSSVTVNVTSGEIISQTPPAERVGSMVLLPNAVSPISFRDDGTPISLPQSTPRDTVIVTKSNDGRVMGWGAAEKAPLWEFVPPQGQKVIQVTSRPSHDPVASIGKVLGDRSVLYKYLNPNLGLITAVTDTTAVFYLVDATSGQILHTVTHDGVDVTEPITSVVSENWFAYSLWSDVTETSDAKGYKLVISELYESPIPNDRGPLADATNFSAIHDSGPRPHVLSQSFVIPDGISHMAVTQTRQGITVRQLLCALSNTNAIVGIPRPVLDPRRPVGRDPTSTEAEEGLFKYSPALEFDPKWFLTHNRDVIGTRAIMSSAALLESTSLVFSYGGDIYGTRVTPSQAFDVLGKGFSKLQLLATVVALSVGVAIIAPIVRKKQVNMLWKA